MNAQKTPVSLPQSDKFKSSRAPKSVKISMDPVSSGFLAKFSFTMFEAQRTNAESHSPCTLNDQSNSGNFNSVTSTKTSSKVLRYFLDTFAWSAPLVKASVSRSWSKSAGVIGGERDLSKFTVSQKFSPAILPPSVPPRVYRNSPHVLGLRR